jgi:hypothetical protein
MDNEFECKAGLIVDLDRKKMGYGKLGVRCNKKEKHPRYSEHSYQGESFKLTWTMEKKNNG